MLGALSLVTSVVLAYLIGSFPTSYLITRKMKGVDIRQVGSKNAGATNVLRTAGKAPALATLIIDILKGTLTVTVVAGFFYRVGIDLDPDFYRGLIGLTVVCGHVWSAFLRFKGGKGVATTIGVGIGLTPIALIPTVLIWLAVFVPTGYVSLASIVALTLFPLLACVTGYSFYTVLFGMIICCLSIYKHRENIVRLLKGSENKTVIFKKR
jgi:glycerol-3-phosphate acyltransferase PlsY